MSQILRVTPQQDVLLLTMIASSSTQASGDAYDIEVSDEDTFALVGSRGTSIGVSSGNKIEITSGLYEITFNGWVQTAANITGSFDYQFQISTDPLFNTSDVAFDRNIQEYGASANVTAVIDPSHTTMLSTSITKSLYFRITCSNGASAGWYLRGDATSAITQIQIRRIGDAL